MNEIEEQYAIYLAKGVVLDKDGFPLGSNHAHVLGGAGHVGAGVASSSKAAAAAESRRKNNSHGLTQGYVLGGKKRAMPKDPREAARIAAERRLLDSQFCLPCNEVIEILGTDSSDEDELGGEKDDDDSDVILVESATFEAKKSSKPKTEHKNGNQSLDTKPKSFNYSTTTTTVTSSDDSIVDLTEDSFDVTNSSSIDDLKKTAYTKSRLSPPTQNQAISDDDDCDAGKAWTCPRCTLCNTSIVLVCEACNLERQPSKQQQKKLRDDEINYIKQNEVDQSLRTFGGFNIYGEKKESRRY